MRFILKFFYFIIFILLALATMFLGGVSGVAGTFYVMVEKGDIEHNLLVMSAVLLISWLVILILRGHNKRVLKRKTQQALAQQEQEQHPLET